MNKLLIYFIHELKQPPNYGRSHLGCQLSYAICHGGGHAFEKDKSPRAIKRNLFPIFLFYPAE